MGPFHKSLIPLAASFILVLGCATPSRTGSQLSQLLATNAQCLIHLDPVWLGTAACTLRTGYFKAEVPELVPLRFDWFQFSDGTSQKIIGRSKREGRESGIYQWRSSLPSDEELLGASTVSALEKFLGPSEISSIWGNGDEMHASARWAFFTLSGPNEVETVSIFCATIRRMGEAERRVDSLRITRGKAVPKR